MVAEALIKHPPTEQESDDAMPTVTVGGHEMLWDDYWQMIREMEKRQIPFKKWIKKEVLPKYKKYLQSTTNKNDRGPWYEVANIFFDRVLHVGFLSLGHIRKDFIQK